jgi:hypothetical protein
MPLEEALALRRDDLGAGENSSRFQSEFLPSHPHLTMTDSLLYFLDPHHTFDPLPP